MIEILGSMEFLIFMVKIGEKKIKKNNEEEKEGKKIGERGSKVKRFERIKNERVNMRVGKGRDYEV